MIAPAIETTRMRAGGDSRDELRGRLHHDVAAGTDPDDYEPRPSDVQAVSESNLILQSEGHLDIWMDSVIDSSGADATAIEVIDSVEPIEKHSRDVVDESDRPRRRVRARG
jgi:ABC-type Zn uptake system ZnuABC Zn-binding protein ZnuA